MRVRFDLMLLALLSTSALAQAGAAPHQHGVAELDLAVSGAQLELSMHAPTEALLGFEHAPQTPAEQAQLQHALAALHAPETLFELPNCQWQTPRIVHQQHGAHADFSAHYQAHCQAPLTLTRLDLHQLFARFKGLETIQVQWVTDQHQHAARASAAQPQVSLD